MDLDNLIYAHGLSPDTRVSFEEKHQLYLEEKEVAFIEKRKYIYMLLIPAFVIGGLIAIRNSGPEMGTYIASPIIWVFPLTALILEVVCGVHGYSAKSMCKVVFRGMLVVYMFGMFIQVVHMTDE